MDILKKKKLYTIVAVMLLTAMYAVIFLFSAESGEESAGLSGRVADFIMSLYEKLTGGGGGGGAAGTEVFPLEAVIRKMAHFTEYLLVGLLSYGIVLIWYAPGLKGSGLVLLQVFLSGAVDELHQYFVPGRAAMFRDVLLDTAGGAVGIILVFMLYRLKKHRSVKKSKNSDKNR